MSKTSPDRSSVAHPLSIAKYGALMGVGSGESAIQLLCDTQYLDTGQSTSSLWLSWALRLIWVLDDE